MVNTGVVSYLLQHARSLAGRLPCLPLGTKLTVSFSSAAALERSVARFLNVASLALRLLQYGFTAKHLQALLEFVGPDLLTLGNSKMTNIAVSGFTMQ